MEGVIDTLTLDNWYSIIISVVATLIRTETNLQIKSDMLSDEFDRQS